MREPTDKEKLEIMRLEIMRCKIDILQNMMTDGQIDVNWAVKSILGFDKKSEYRILKIKRIFNV